MRIKLDENLPAELATLLQQNGHDVDTVTTEELTGQPDEVVWEAAGKAGIACCAICRNFWRITIWPHGTACWLWPPIARFAYAPDKSARMR